MTEMTRGYQGWLGIGHWGSSSFIAGGFGLFGLGFVPDGRRLGRCAGLGRLEKLATGLLIGDDLGVVLLDLGVGPRLPGAIDLGEHALGIVRQRAVFDDLDC